MSYPFSENTPKNSKRYWKKFIDLFLKEEGFCCAIIGVGEPWLHWVVVEPTIAGQILFSDSDGRYTGDVYRMDIESIRAGKRRAKHGEIKATPNEVIVFRRFNE